MNWANYLAVVEIETKKYFIENGYIDNFKNNDWDYNDFSELMDEIELRVSGNDNGSYYFNPQKAQEAVSRILSLMMISMTLPSVTKLGITSRSIWESRMRRLRMLLLV